MSFRWDEESKNKLREFWASGLSSSLIGKEMGLTKNSIIGAANRMKLTPRPSPIGGAARPITKTLIALKAQEKPVEAFEISAPVVAAKPKKILHMPGSVAVKACRFPNGDPRKSNFRFCGNPTREGKPYCAACCEVAYIRPMRAA